MGLQSRLFPPMPRRNRPRRRLAPEARQQRALALHKLGPRQAHKGLLRLLTHSHNPSSPRPFAALLTEKPHRRLLQEIPSPSDAIKTITPASSSPIKNHGWRFFITYPRYHNTDTIKSDGLKGKIGPFVTSLSTNNFHNNHRDGREVQKIEKVQQKLK